MHILRNIIQKHKKNGYGGIFSVCSSHILVIEVVAFYYKQNNYYLPLEAASNQMNRWGSYTGYTPKKFIEYATNIINKVDLKHSLIIFAEDHLGPNFWQKYYEASPKEQKFARKFSLNDHICYYWNKAEVKETLKRLFENLKQAITLPLIRQYFPDLYDDVRTVFIKHNSKNLVWEKIMKICDNYQQACEA